MATTQRSMNMYAAKKKALESKGWKIGTPKEFLNLSSEEAAYVELKLSLSKDLQKTRRHKLLARLLIG